MATAPVTASAVRIKTTIIVFACIALSLSTRHFTDRRLNGA
jgi:hypothetical protein